MGRFLPLLLTRAATIVVAGMLLFAVFAPAHAQSNSDDNYGLKRFSGDNYDTVPAPGRDAPAPPVSAPLAPAPATTVPAGYYPTLHGSTAAPAPAAAPAPVSAAPNDDRPVLPTQPAIPTPRLVATPVPQGDAYAYNRPPADAAYPLGFGDKIRLTVYGEPDLSGEYQVDGSGMVRLPLIGTLRAAGYTARHWSRRHRRRIGPGLSQGSARSMSRSPPTGPSTSSAPSTGRANMPMSTT